MFCDLIRNIIHYRVKVLFSMKSIKYYQRSAPQIAIFSYISGPKKNVVCLEVITEYIYLTY